MLDVSIADTEYMAQMVDTAPQPTQPAAIPPAAAQAPVPAGPPLGGAPPATQILLDQRAPQRASLLDGLRGLRPGGEAPAAAAGSPQASAAPAPGTSPGSGAPTDQAAAVAPPAEPAKPDAAAPPTSPPASSAPEPEEHPGMVQVRKAEQHARQRIADERAQLQADFDRQKAAWTPQLAELERLRAVIANARQDPAALFAAAGFTDADYEPLAQIAYSMSPEIQKDPRAAHGRKIAGMQSLAARAQAAEQEKIRTELQALRDEQAKRDAAAAAEQNVQRYLQTVTRAVGDATPHVRYAMGRAPEDTQRRLLAVADRLYNESGPSNDLRDVPTPAQVLKAYEQERASHVREVLAELEALGIDPRSFGKSTPAAAPPPAIAAAAGAAPATAPPPAAAPTAPAASVQATQPERPVATAPAQPQNEDDRRQMALAELRKLRFAG